MKQPLCERDVRFGLSRAVDLLLDLVQLALQANGQMQTCRVQPYEANDQFPPAGRYPLRSEWTRDRRFRQDLSTALRSIRESDRDPDLSQSRGRANRPASPPH